jgi:MoxR-like ATPase
VLGLASKRVQFTPDLMPADILRSEVLDEGADGRRSFRFVPSPVFCQLLMADEINRASVRTQSALLAAMFCEASVTACPRLPEPALSRARRTPVARMSAYYAHGYNGVHDSND